MNYGHEAGLPTFSPLSGARLSAVLTFGEQMCVTQMPALRMPVSRMRGVLVTAVEPLYVGLTHEQSWIYETSIGGLISARFYVLP